MTQLLDDTSQLKRRLKEMLELEKHLKAERPELKPDCSLEEFTKMAWPIYEPSVELRWSWHLSAIAEHLEAVSSGKIHNLVINIPPRLSKSSMVCVFWPLWDWTHHPGRKFLFSSYGSELSERDSRACRRIIASQWYQAKYGKIFQIRKDGDTVGKFENTQGGFRQATSVGGVGTGAGGDIIICDDPIKADDGNSKTRRDLANRWWAETMASRLNDQKTGAKVVIMQRLHEEDLTGYILAHNTDDEYDHLCLPMLYEKNLDQDGNELPKHYTSIGFCDPRTEDGEILCKERFGPKEIERLRESGTEYSWAGQYQQRPSPRGGGMFRIDKITVVPAIPTDAKLIRCRAWDRAGTQDGGAYTAGIKVAWDVPSGVYYVEDMCRGQWATDQREAMTKKTAKEDGTTVRILLEQEPGSAGIDSVRATTSMLISDPNMPRGYSVHAIRSTGSKEVRAESLATAISLDKVKFVQGEYVQPLLREMESFPNSRFKDQCDAFSLAYNFLAQIILAPQRSISSEPPVRFSVR